MKRTRSVRSVLALLGLGAVALIMLGCPVTSSEDCAALGTCDDGAGGGTTTGTTGTTASTTTSTTVPTECSDIDVDDVVGEDCGVFVSPQGGSDEAGDGMRQSPYATLAKAIEAAPSKPIFVCSGELGEALVVTAGADVRLFGGFTCDTWSYTGEKATLTAPADAVPVTVDEGALFSAQDFTITAASATTEGTSSIALFAREDADVELTRVDLVAGDGAPGVAGTTPTRVGPNGEGATGGNGTMGAPGCAETGNTDGGPGAVNMCGATSSVGGLGGSGLAMDFGGDGSDGQPKPAGGDNGGAGAQVGGGACIAGNNGQGGENAADGAGAADLGALSNDGFAGAAGATGGTGTPGQGGGGGGGAKKCANSNAGPSGGGGGAGGCGGAGGGGGGAGGASIALAAFNAKRLQLSTVTLKTGAGGLGGKGGDAQGGGGGGGPGLGGGSGACAGGSGGPGGNGGAGGGGRGGHSVGLAFSGPQPATETVSFMLGAAGQGGPGGADNSQPEDGAGALGVTQDTLEL